MNQRSTTAAAQAWKTEGLPAMERPGAVTRVFMAIVALAERLNRACARFGNPCVYDTATFPWAAAIERDWRVVREELDRVMVRNSELPNVQDIAADAVSLSQDANWKVFPFLMYGVRSQPNIDLCPHTWRLVQGIPRLRTAMFSILGPGKRLPPHRGPYNGVLRLHLGLLVPQPVERAAIRVGPEQRHWADGRVLIFDDAYEHEAWNETTHPRVVLFVDFEKPLRFPASAINRLLLDLAPLTPFLRESANNLRQWERSFHGHPS